MTNYTITLSLPHLVFDAIIGRIESLILHNDEDRTHFSIEGWQVFAELKQNRAYVEIDNKTYDDKLDFTAMIIEDKINNEIYPKALAKIQKKKKKAWEIRETDNLLLAI